VNPLRGVPKHTKVSDPTTVGGFQLLGSSKARKLSHRASAKMQANLERYTQRRLNFGWVESHPETLTNFKQDWGVTQERIAVDAQ